MKHFPVLMAVALAGCSQVPSVAILGAEDVCWTATFHEPSEGIDNNSYFKGCGSEVHSAPLLAVSATKVSGDGPLCLEWHSEGRIKALHCTTATDWTVTVDT